LELTLHNRAPEIRRAHEALDQFAAELSLPVAGLARLHVALEEHLTNIISYGYRPGQTGTIQVRFSFTDSNLRVEIDDDARPYNPLAAPDVDTSVPLEAKPVGGLGVLLIRQCVDKIEYQRAGERNLLVLVKRLEIRPQRSAKDYRKA
jgi:anti-sigma regulatory factor (Ser/Thr protein kinase)